MFIFRCFLPFEPALCLFFKRKGVKTISKDFLLLKSRNPCKNMISIYNQVWIVFVTGSLSREVILFRGLATTGHMYRKTRCVPRILRAYSCTTLTNISRWCTTLTNTLTGGTTLMHLYTSAVGCSTIRLVHSSIVSVFPVKIIPWNITESWILPEFR